MEFFDRASGSVLEGKYEILFNMYLVKGNTRPAFLLELAGFPEVEPETLLAEVGRIYPEFKYTHEHLMNERPHRVFVHINPLSPFEGGDMDKWVAINLGFLCLGLPARDEEVINIQYTLVTGNGVYPVYVEMCRKEGYDELRHRAKLDAFNSLANPLGWRVEMYVNEVGTTKYIDMIMKGLISGDSDDIYEIHGILENAAITDVANSLRMGYYTWDELFENKKLIIFKLLQADYTPVDAYYPFDEQTSDLNDEAQNSSFTDINKDPIDMYNDYENTEFVQDLLKYNGDKKKQKYMTIKEKLFSLYRGYFP